MNEYRITFTHTNGDKYTPHDVFYSLNEAFRYIEVIRKVLSHDGLLKCSTGESFYVTLNDHIIYEKIYNPKTLSEDLFY